MAAIRRLKRPIHLILDWDGTITVKDTMYVLGELPRARDARTAKGRTSRSSEGIDGKANATEWDYFVKSYMKDYDSHKSQHFPKVSSKGEYTAWLASLKPVEERSRQRVSESGFFRGVKNEDVAMVAKHAVQTGKVQLRPGWTDLYELLQSGNSSPAESRLSILSVNWSATFIRNCLRSAAPEECTHLRKSIDDVEIDANEIEGLDLPAGSLSGQLVGDMHTSADKVARLQQFGSAFVVYVGDSPTDFDSLEAADVGIWLCDVPTFDAAREKFHETFKPLQLDLQPITDLKAGTGLLYWSPTLELIADSLAALGSNV